MSVALALAAPGADASPATCGVPPLVAPDYYAIDLVPTARVPGTRNATGTAAVGFVASPYGVSLAADGQYEQRISISVEGLPAPRRGAYVAWVTPPTLDPITRVGGIAPGEPLAATVTWNKFLVVITLEFDPSPDAVGWEGPIVLRGISRSGRMHTMAGHGAFEAEPCAKYGY